MPHNPANKGDLRTPAGDSAMDETNDAVNVNIVAGSAAGGTSMTDDAAFTPGTSSVNPIGAMADEAAPDSVDEGDVGSLRMTADRKLLTRIVGATDGNRADVDASGHLQVDIAADSVGIGGGTQYAVDDALGANPTGTLALAKRDDALAALTPVEGDAIELRVDANGALWIKVSGTVTVDGSGVTQPVSAASLPLPTGAATEATLGSVKTAVETIDNAIAGTEMQVDVVAALPAGTNAIGKLAANSGVDIGDVDVLSIAAGTNVIGRVAAIPATSAIYNGTTSTTPVFVAVDVATSGDNTLVAAQGASNKIRVYACILVAAAAVTVRFESGAGGTALTGQMQLAANSGFVLPFNPLGWFETAANALLNLELSGAISVDGSLVYSVVQ